MGSSESTLNGNPLLTGNGDMPPWVLVVFEFSDWRTRANLMMTSKRWWRNCSEQSFFRFLANRLAVENGVYVPAILPANETWKGLFSDLYKLRNLWSPAQNVTVSSHQYSKESVGERFKISVFARFRPHDKTAAKKAVTEGDADIEHEEVEVTLPLHQRLAMIKMSRKLKSNRQALKILTSEGGWFKSRWTSLGNEENISNSENVNHVQTRGGATFDADQDIPQFAKHMHAGHSKAAKQGAAVFIPSHDRSVSPNAEDGTRMVACVQSVDPLTGRVVMVAPDVGLREFSFDSVLHPKATQKSVYDASARRLVMDFLNGFNSTAIVYGQTGSGKTFSMFGTEIPDNISVLNATRQEAKGIVPRACEEIFAALERRRWLNGIESEVSVSYVEVFGDEVSDLLKRGARCGQSKVAAQQFVLSGAAERVIYSMQDVEEVLRIGEQQKRRAATNMNDRSTRAHSLFIMTLKQSQPGNTSVTLNSRLFLADLGGSEQVKKSGVDAGHTREGQNEDFSLGFELGAHMREAVNINLGLLALKKCIEALNNRALYTPYQDSKLTMLLSAGLGGNSKTSIIVCANMDPTHATETVATLRFGEKCALIETSARNNATMLAGVLAALDAQIASLEEEITRKERWELRNEERADTLAEEGTVEMAAGGVEIKKVYMLVGAEEERRQLEKLLIRRAKFIGSEPIADEADETEESQGAEGSTHAAATVRKPSTKRTKVVGFGKEYAELYGLGGKFDESAEYNTENSRFAQGLADETALPKAVRSHKGTKSWATGAPIAEENAAVLEKNAKRLRRTRLAYSGISA